MRGAEPPISTDPFLTADAACTAESTMGPSKTRESVSYPSTSRSLHLILTDEGTRFSEALPSIIAAATVTFPLFRNPAFESRTAGSQTSSSGWLNEYTADAAATASGSRDLMSASGITFPVQSS